MPRDLLPSEVEIDVPPAGGGLRGMAELMATPDHMLAWLRSKHPSDVAAEDMSNIFACLGATFLQEMGHPRAIWAVHDGTQYNNDLIVACKPIGDAISELARARHGLPVTAAQAIDALDRAIAARKAKG